MMSQQQKEEATPLTPPHQAPHMDKSMVAFAQSAAAFTQSLTDQSCGLLKRFNIHIDTEPLIIKEDE